jgi:hypothetical protein
MTDSGATVTASNKTSTGKTATQKAIHWSPNREMIIPPASEMISSLAKVSSSGSYASRPREPIYQDEGQQPLVLQSRLLSSKDVATDNLVTTDTSDGLLCDPIRYDLSSLLLGQNLEPQDVPPSRLSPDRSASTSQTAINGNIKPSYLDRLPDELLLEILKLMIRRDGLTVLSSWFVKGGDRVGGIVPPVRRGCPWRGSQKPTGFGQKVPDILNLRLVNRRWDRLVADEFFRNNVILEHMKLAPRSREACDGAWFVPWRHSNSVEGTEIVIRYHRKQIIPGGGQSIRHHNQILSCTREVLCLGRVRGTSRGWRISDAIHPEQQAFVQSDYETGLRIRGFHFHITFTDANWLSAALTNVIRIFIWTLMNCPDQTPMEDGKYLLDLGKILG